MRGQIGPWDGRVLDTGWVNLQLLNSWVGFDSGLSIGGVGRAAGVRKVNGIVFFRGVIKSGASNSVAFQLPAGFRPGIQTIYENSGYVPMNGGAGQYNIDATTGNVVLTGAGVTTFCYVQGIAPYPAET